MIPNLNFYDIYGYLIPGFALSILIWLPLGLTQKRWPSAAWTSALAVAVIAYIAGHLVQALARNAVPSKTMRGRFPSDVLLDKDNVILSTDLKTRLRDRIKRLSGIDVRTDCEGRDVTREVSRLRRDGFYFCRDALLAAKIVTYAEQMQGMYALMSGLTMGFLLAIPYHLGWVFSNLQCAPLKVFAWISVGLGLTGAILIAMFAAFGQSSPLETGTKGARWTVVFILVALLGCGYVLGSGNVQNLDQACPLGAIALAGGFASLTCYRVYKYFTVVYAQTIYHAFSVYEKPARPADAK